MADLGIVENSLASLEDDLRRVLKYIFQYVLADVRFGRAITKTPSKNFGAVFQAGTTPHVANTEFSILHGFGRPPYLVIPVLPLDTVNATLVPLTVTRAADSTRVYLSSSVIDASFIVMIEG